MVSCPYKSPSRLKALPSPYVTSSLGGAILRVPKAGGPAKTLVSAAQPDQIIVDATNIYWTSSANGNLNKAPLAGGNPTLVDTSVTADILTQSEANLFYVKKAPVGQAYFSVLSRPKGGGEATGLTGCAGEVFSATADDSDAFALCFVAGSAWVARGPTQARGGIAWGDHASQITSPPGGPMLLDGDNIYFNTPKGPLAIHRCLNAFAAKLVGSESARVLAYDADSVYWTSGDAIARTPK
jgi:hypothetical protein